MEFNEVAARFFDGNAPRGSDLEDAITGFESFFVAALPNANRAEITAHGESVLVEAAHLDEAYRRIFRAPESSPFRPTADDAARLLDMTLLPSPALAIVVEQFPLLELRKKILESGSDARVAIPAPLATPRAWALLRAAEGTMQFALELREAELLEKLERSSVRDALAELEQNCSGRRARTIAGKNSGMARSQRSARILDGADVAQSPTRKNQSQTTQL